MTTSFIIQFPSVINGRTFEWQRAQAVDSFERHGEVLPFSMKVSVFLQSRRDFVDFLSSASHVSFGTSNSRVPL